MAGSRWTLMLVPHGNEQVRSFQVSARSIRNLVYGVLAVTLTLGTFSVGFFVKQGQHVRAAQLRRENELLAAEVEGMRGQMKQLDGAIQQLSAKDEKYRVIAGLPDVTAEVREAGIGGPGTGTSLSATALAHLNPGVGQRVAATSTDLAGLLRKAALLRASMDEALTALQHNREKLASVPSIAPSSGHLSSLFSPSRHHPVLRITRPHKGIDIAAPVGDPILAPAKGVVRFAGNKANGYGNMVEIDHGFGYVTRFAHASRLNVRTGETVKRGQVIALVGATGLTSGPHLHYEVEVGGSSMDPLNFIIGEAIPD